MKIWFIIGTLLILSGFIIFCMAMKELKWDFDRLSTVLYEKSEYQINQKFTNIDIITDTADILFEVSEVSSMVICNEEKKIKHVVKVVDDTLEIHVDNQREWYENIGINFDRAKITIYIPEGEYDNLKIKSSTGDVYIPKYFKFENIDIYESTGDVFNYAEAGMVKIKTSTGDVSVSNIFVDNLDIITSTGDVLVSDIECLNDIKINASTGNTGIKNVKSKNIISSGSSGDIKMSNVLTNDKISIKRSTGDVDFHMIDAGEIYIKTDTGDVEGSLLSEKMFMIRSDTGDIDVPRTVTGGICEIETDTGDIEIEIKR